MIPCYASLLLFSFFSDSYSYRRFFLSSCRSSPSLNPLPTSSQSSDLPLRAESRDLECSVGEVAVRETGSPAAADPITPEVTVAMAVGTSEEVVGASQDTALVLPSLPVPTSPSTPLGTSSQCLDDDVLLQFDATHHLSELTAAWGALSTSFGEKLQVSFSEVLSLDVCLSSVLMCCFSLSLFAQSFSRDHTSFCFSSKTEKKLSSEVSTLKAELDLCRAELETER